MTEWQKKKQRRENYRKFLQTPVWKAIRARKISEVGAECEDCGAKEFLQCHHLEYPKVWADTTSEQLIVLCRDCHRKEEGYQSLAWIRARNAVSREFDYLRRPTKEMWLTLRRSMTDNPMDIEDFGNLMWKYIRMILFSEKFPNGNPVREVSEPWSHRAFTVRKNIWSRAPAQYQKLFL